MEGALGRSGLFAFKLPLIIFTRRVLEGGSHENITILQTILNLPSIQLTQALQHPPIIPTSLHSIGIRNSSTRLSSSNDHTQHPKKKTTIIQFRLPLIHQLFRISFIDPCFINSCCLLPNLRIYMIVESSYPFVPSFSRFNLRIYYF